MITILNHILLHVPMSIRLSANRHRNVHVQMMFSLRHSRPGACVRSRSRFAFGNNYNWWNDTASRTTETLSNACDRLGRRERMQKTRTRYARSSQLLLTRMTAPVGALATSMNINYSDGDEMPRTPAHFPHNWSLDCCRLRQPICKFARGLCLRL